MGLPFCEQVYVVGHVAVRENCNLLVARSALDLRTNGLHCIRRDEVWFAFVRAKREEILAWTEIFGKVKVPRPIRTHAIVMASGVPRSPAEAGRYKSA